MIECQVCTAPATLSLCGPCTRMLRTMLASLVAREVVSLDGKPVHPPRQQPGWLAILDDTAIGHVRLGDGGGRHGEFRSQVELDGETALAEVVGVYPKDTEDDLEEAREQRARTVQRRFLAAGGVNARADHRLDLLTNMLSTWIRDLCETHGRVFMPIRSMPPGFIGPLRADWRRLPPNYAATATDMAMWLRHHVDTVACHEGAGEFYDELAEHIRAIERLVNRPPVMQFCGPCPTYREDRRAECGTRLLARPGAVEVRCPTCRKAHNIERLIIRLMANVEHWRFTREELIGERTGDWSGIMGLLDEPVSKSTFHRWTSKRSLRPSGYRRPSGSIGLTNNDERDEPVYRLSKVRQLRAAMRTKQATGMQWR